MSASRLRLSVSVAALNSAWLNESATLYRRRYYSNGSHAGFILSPAPHAGQPSLGIASTHASATGTGHGSGEVAHPWRSIGK